MADENTTQGQENPSEVTGSGTQAKPTNQAPDNDNETGSHYQLEVSPEAREAISRANDQAAKERIKRNEAQKEVEELRQAMEQLQGTVSKQFEDRIKKIETDFQEAEARAREAELNVIRLKVASEAGLPPALAERLKGDDVESIKADAEALRATLPSGVTNVRTGNATPPPPKSRAREFVDQINGANQNPWDRDLQRSKKGGPRL